jgi:hypothetical protein
MTDTQHLADGSSIGPRSNMTLDDAIIATDGWEQQRAATEARISPSGHRAVVRQTTRERTIYRHELTLSCGHTEYRTGGGVGIVIRRVRCAACAPASPVVEEAKARGWLERLLPRRAG